ncbi:MAG: 50S ribosomal protein L18 [Gemmatimonadales bacterium]|jgi:large subunit ribosomal protein L18
MRLTRNPRTRKERRFRRHLRVRRKVRGTADRPRLVVFRSLKYIYAQLVDDDRGVTLAAASDRGKDVARDNGGKVGAARAVGKLLAQRAGEQQITRVVFDRAGYPYHGRVRAVAEGAREGGLEF